MTAALLPARLSFPRRFDARFWLVLGSLALGSASCLSVGEQDAVEIGERVVFDLPALDGRRLGPASFPGKVVLVEFWATWCGPCHLQAEVLHGLRWELEDRGVQVLSINLGEDERTVRAFLAERPSSFPVLLDPDSTLGGPWQIDVLPSFLAVDRAGRLVAIEKGLLTRPRLRELVQRADRSS